MSQRKLGILLSYVNILLHAVLGFIYVPILLFYIGKSEYGLYQLIGSLIAYFSIMDFGLTAAVTRFYTKYKALQDKNGMENILAISLYGFGIVTCISFIIGCIAYVNLDVIFGNSMTLNELEEAKDLFLLLLFNIIVGLSTMLFRSVINAHQRFLFLKGLETVQLIMQPILVVLILQHYPSAMAVAIVQTALNVALILARMYYSFKYLHIKIKFHYWDIELFSSFRRLAFSVFVVTLIDQVFWKTNQIILGVTRGTEEVAVYSIAALIYMNYMALSLAISGVYLPHITEMVAHRKPVEELSALFTQIGRWQYYLLALVASGFILFGQQFIEIWAGKDFYNAYWITLLIILPFTIDLIQNIGLSILQAMNKYDLRAKVYFFIGLLNLALAIPLGIQYGGLGCAIATGIAMLVGNGFIMNYLYSKYIGLHIKEFWRQIGKISLVVLACLGVGIAIDTLWVTNSTVLFGVKILVYIAVYCVGIYWFAMNEGEQLKIKNVVKKIG